MKIVYKALFIILLFMNSNVFSQKNNLPIFTAQLNGWHGNKEFLIDSSLYRYVKTSITNSSPDTLCYLTMTCSWEQFYIIDSKELSLPMKSCDENGLTLMQIPPHKTIEKLLLLRSSKNKNQLHNIKFKIGFKFYKVNYNNIKNRNSYPDIYKYFTPKNELLLWSNTLEL